MLDWFDLFFFMRPFIVHRRFVGIPKAFVAMSWGTMSSVLFWMFLWLKQLKQKKNGKRTESHSDLKRGNFGI